MTADTAAPHRAAASRPLLRLSNLTLSHPRMLATSAAVGVVMVPGFITTIQDGGGATSTPSLRTLSVLLIVGTVPSLLLFVKGCFDAALFRTLLGSGMPRRQAFAAALRSSVTAAACFSLLTALVVCIDGVATGDFSGRLVVDGQTAGNLWLFAIDAAILCLAQYWTAFAIASLFVRFRLYVGLAISALILASRFSVSDDAGEPLAQDVVEMSTSSSLLWGLVDIGLFLFVSWLLLRRLPIRR